VRPAHLLALVLLPVLLAACDSEPDPSTRPIHSVADFDKHPCGLFTDDEIKGVVAQPFELMAGADPAMSGRPKTSSTDDGPACVYVFAPSGGARDPHVATITVSLGLSRSGQQQLDLCLQGAAARAQGYEGVPIGEKACTTPSADLWMRVGTAHYHVVTVAQPGWSDPFESHVRTRTVSMSVANAAAQRLPRS